MRGNGADYLYLTQITQISQKGFFFYLTQITQITQKGFPSITE